MIIDGRKYINRVFRVNRVCSCCNKKLNIIDGVYVIYSRKFVNLVEKYKFQTVCFDCINNFPYFKIEENIK